MKGILMVCLLAGALAANAGIRSQMVTYNEIHSDLATDCAREIEQTDRLHGGACRRYFDFLDSSRDLRAVNRQWLSQVELSAEQQSELLHFVERGNRAMSYIVRRSKALAPR